MATYKLDNVFYETTNPSKVERLVRLGAVEVKEEVPKGKKKVGDSDDGITEKN